MFSSLKAFKEIDISGKYALCPGVFTMRLPGNQHQEVFQFMFVYRVNKTHICELLRLRGAGMQIFVVLKNVMLAVFPMF